MQTDISEAGLQGGGVGKEYLTVFQPWLKRDTPPSMLFAWAELELIKSQHPWKGLGAGGVVGKQVACFPGRPRTAAGPSAEEDPAPHQGALSRWSPSPATAGGDFLELVLGKAVFRRGRAIITAESSMRLLGSWLQSWEALRGGLGGGGGATCREPALGVL